VQLFDLENDPGEQHDLSAAEPERATELRARLQAWRKAISAAMPTARPEP